MHHTVPSSVDIDWRTLASSSDAPAYSQSKLALHMLAYELNRRLSSKRIFCVPVNPGAVNSSIWRGSSDCVKTVARWAFLTPYIGAQPVIYAAASESIPLLDGERLYLNPYVPVFEWAEKARDSWLRAHLRNSPLGRVSLSQYSPRFLGLQGAAASANQVVLPLISTARANVTMKPH